MARTDAPLGHSRLRGKLDRSSALPLYYQLKQALSESINDHFQPGDRVPGELELCAFYEVSRSVVRQALYELEAEGTVERRRGQGTFVAERKTSEGLFQSLAGLYDEVTARGQQLYSRVLESCQVPAAPIIARELDVAVGQTVCFIERLRFVDGEPWALDRAYLPASLVPGLLKEDLSRQSLYGLLQQRYGIVLHKARRSVEAVAANDSVVKALRVSPGDPVLLLRSTAWDATGRPVEHFSTYFRGDRSSFEVTLEGRSSAQSLSFAAGQTPNGS